MQVKRHEGEEESEEGKRIEIEMGTLRSEESSQDEKVRLDRAHNLLVVGSIGKGTSWRQHSLYE